MYKGWDSEALSIQSEIVNEILLYCYLTPQPPIPSETTTATSPTNIENEISNLESSENLEELKRLSVALNIDRRCNICSIVNLCLKQNKSWIYDYSLLCYKCNYAPKTPLSLLIVSAEFIMLIRERFPNINFDGLFQNNIVSIFDFHVHFFIHRCFANTVNDHIQSENITLNHMAIIRSTLLKEDSIPHIKIKKFLTKKMNPKKTQNPELNKKLTVPMKTRFTTLLFYMWSGTNVFDRVPFTDLTIRKHRFIKNLYSNKTNIELTAGPILLAQIPFSITKNKTTSVCLLCELMAASKQDYLFLKYLHQSIMDYCQNNLKMIDRVQFVIADIFEKTKIHMHVKNLSDYSKAIFDNEFSFSDDNFTLDTHVYLILRQTGTVGVYKHFFCDPLCLANCKTINPEVLFNTTDAGEIQDLKVTICYRNEYLSIVEKHVWLAIHLFKAFQIIKPNHKNKTQIAEFLKDFTNLLALHHFDIVDPIFTVNYYV
uniref:Packaging protein UL32 n=1 Tax=Human betaherpesvirus 6 TaxID=10368 RepID=A0A1W6DB92_9BETA|nr:U36 [Human betaherpesvirus 6]